MLRLLTNKTFNYNLVTSLNQKHPEILKQLVQTNSLRYTSTTSSSKGQAISITSSNLNTNVAEAKHHEQSSAKLDLTFEDSKTAFKSKSNFQLLRGYLVFQLCSLNFLIDNQKALLDLSKKLLGKKLFNLLMRSTFYGHFVAGEDQVGIRPNVETMMKYGVKSILDYSAEEDLATVRSADNTSESDISSLTEFKKRKLLNPAEIQFEKNTKIFMDCVDAVSDVTNSTGIGAVKITSLIRPELLLKFSSLVSGLIKNQNQKDLFSWKSLLEKSDEEFSQIFNQLPEVKFDGIELGELRNMLLRIDDILEHAIKQNVRIFIDAEQTYFQDGIRRIAVELMRNFNKKKCVVLNTYQNYLTSALDTLKEDLELSNKENFYFGAKLVRGAYMEQERERASKMGYSDPINPDYDATTRMYESSFVYCLNEIKKRPLGQICLMVASHNESTVKFAVEKMQEYNIVPADRIICFGQLFGMCDYISFYLGGVGYSVYKYVPYGPVDEVLPYLSRRATENRGIFEKVKKEKRLILKELKRRIQNFEFTYST
jgi:proline dehydrogenase